MFYNGTIYVAQSDQLVKSLTDKIVLPQPCMHVLLIYLWVLYSMSRVNCAACHSVYSRISDLGGLGSLGVKTANELKTIKRFILKYHHPESELQSHSQ